MSVYTYISKEHSDLIKDELAPQFLGLWIKMFKDGIPADVGKRALASALFRTCSHLNETRGLYKNEEFLKLCVEIGGIIEKYHQKGFHYAVISASLELQITNILGTRSEDVDV